MLLLAVIAPFSEASFPILLIALISQSGFWFELFASCPFEMIFLSGLKAPPCSVPTQLQTKPPQARTEQEEKLKEAF